jgi:ATP-dependent DNA helicase RecQ
LPPSDRALFLGLRARRLEIAQAQNVPAYVVFNDRTLVEMARQRPRSAIEMGSLPGVGTAKLERYGKEFLKVIADADTSSFSE